MLHNIVLIMLRKNPVGAPIRLPDWQLSCVCSACDDMVFLWYRTFPQGGYLQPPQHPLSQQCKPQLPVNFEQHFELLHIIFTVSPPGFRRLISSTITLPIVMLCVFFFSPYLKPTLSWTGDVFSHQDKVMGLGPTTWTGRHPDFKQSCL